LARSLLSNIQKPVIAGCDDFSDNGIEHGRSKDAGQVSVMLTGLAHSPGRLAMYHTIKFNRELAVDLNVGQNRRLERLLLRAHDRVTALLRPCILETVAGPVEAADLVFEDGTTASAVPYSAFRFVE